MPGLEIPSPRLFVSFSSPRFQLCIILDAGPDLEISVWGLSSEKPNEPGNLGDVGGDMPADASGLVDDGGTRGGGRL